MVGRRRLRACTYKTCTSNSHSLSLSLLFVKLQESRCDTKQRGLREVINSILIALMSDWSGVDGQAFSSMPIALWTITRRHNSRILMCRIVQQIRVYMCFQNSNKYHITRSSWFVLRSQCSERSRLIADNQLPRIISWPKNGNENEIKPSVLDHQQAENRT